MNTTQKIPPSVFVYLAVGIVALSQSANIIRIGDAHPTAIAAWRLLLAGLGFLPLARQRLSQLKGLDGRDRVFLFLAGGALFLHFHTWIAAVQNTTVANAAIVVSINPVFTALLSHLIFKEHISRKLLAAILLGIVGVTIIGFGDLSIQPEHFKGDTLALISTLFLTFYMLLGKRLRRSLATPVYVSTLYLIASGFGFAALLLLDVPIAGYSQQTWLCFFLMALIPTMIGHTSINNALQHMGAGRVSAAILIEPLLAAIVAYFAWNEVISGPAIVGYAFIVVSASFLILDMKPQSSSQ